MIRFKAGLMFLALALVITTVASAGRLESETVEVDAKGAENIDVSIEFGAGEILMVPADIKSAAVFDVEYTPRRFDFDVDYEVKRGTGYLLAESIVRRKTDVDTEDNRWEVTMSTRYPMVMELEMGACDAELDLGGIQLEGLKIEVGAASARLDFSAPNPVRLEEIEIEAGAASLEMEGGGNANFDFFSFEGGAGSFDLDFRGDYDGESEITIDVGLGSADIVLPDNIPCRVEAETDGWLSSVDFHGDDLDEIDDDVYESPDFDDADTRIVIRIDVGLGSVDLYWK